MNDDQIIIEGLHCYGYHGVNPEERVLGQRFLVDVTIEADLREAGRTDDLARTISYSDAARRSRAIVEGEARHLLETESAGAWHARQSSRACSDVSSVLP